jgi:hypothetical protein
MLRFPDNKKGDAPENQADGIRGPSVFLNVYHEKQKIGMVVRSAGGVR